MRNSYRNSKFHKLIQHSSFKIVQGLTFIAHPSDGVFDYLILEDADETPDVLAMEMIDLKQTRLPKSELKSDGLFWLTATESTASALEMLLSEPYILRKPGVGRYILECMNGSFEGSSKAEVFCAALLQKLDT